MAYKSAAHDTLSLAVRVAAADALDVMDQGKDKTAANEALKVVLDAVRGCRTGYLRINNDESAWPPRRSTTRLPNPSSV